MIVAEVQVADLSYCNSNGNDAILCGYRQGISVCGGDSGGPAVINNEIHGIISFSYSCDTNYMSVGMTAVYKFYHWLDTIMFDEKMENSKKIQWQPSS